jgi:hypothetical protein
MCEPTTIAYGIAAVLAAGSAYSASETSKNQAEYQGKVNQNNQKTAEWQAQDALQRGNAEAAATRRKYSALQGTQRASLAAKGLDISDGSANAVLTDTEFFSQVDENTVHANAARAAWGYKNQAANFGSNAAAYQASADGQNPMLSGAMAGASSYFSSAGRGGGGSKAAGTDNSLMSDASMVDPRWYENGRY